MNVKREESLWLNLISWSARYLHCNTGDCVLIYTGTYLCLSAVSPFNCLLTFRCIIIAGWWFEILPKMFPL
jgi:hypothetical protein